MRILVAGASGAVGRQLVPRLVADGHEVAGTSRSPRKLDELRSMGATPLLVDALDAGQVADAVARFEPEAIVHQLTDLKEVDFRTFERSFAMTNRLRTEGTVHLLAAGRAVGVQRFVVQSYAGWPFGPGGAMARVESDPLDDDPLPAMRPALDAFRHLEAATLDAEWTEGIVLRFGNLIGPGTGLDADGPFTAAIRDRKVPLIGGGTGIWSFLDTRDAAEATIAALERGRRGIYHVVDDEPAPVGTWLPLLADRLGAKPPMRVPRLVGRLLGGPVIVRMMTEVRGASNAKAKRELGWQPRFGWKETLGVFEARPDGGAAGDASGAQVPGSDRVAA